QSLQRLVRETERPIPQAAPLGPPRVVAPDLLLLDVDAEELHFMTTAYGRAAGEAALAVGLRVVEGVVPVDADDAGVADEAAEELVQAEGVGVAGNVVLVLGGLHDGEAAAAGVARRVDAGDRVEPGGGLVESDGVLLGQVASPLPE